MKTTKKENNMRNNIKRTIYLIINKERLNYQMKDFKPTTSKI